MKKFANNIFSSWRTTLLGVVVLGYSIYLVEAGVISDAAFSRAIEILGGAAFGFLINSNDKENGISK